MGGEKNVWHVRGGGGKIIEKQRLKECPKVKGKKRG